MVRLAIIDQDGKTLPLKDVASAAELLVLVEQARGIIRECERVAWQLRPKSPAPGAGQIPYLT
jgi:hypothetical protein